VWITEPDGVIDTALELLNGQSENAANDGMGRRTSG
jgi:hypothetical protein